MKLIKQQRVSASISDAQANLSVLGVFQVIQDCVTEMMGKLKIDGITARKKYNAVWVFVRNRVKLLSSIAWSDDEFTADCFISAITRATIYVDVAIKDHNGVLCAYSRLELCALDIDTMRIRRVDTVGVTESVKAESPETDIVFTKFDCAPQERVDRVQIHSTNIDISQHTNNVEYIRFMLNTYSVKELKDRPIREMEIRYVNQSYENDVVDIYKENAQGKDVFLLKSGDKDIVKCEILF